MEIPITTVKPQLLRIFDINTLIPSVVHTYHFDSTEPITVQYQVMKQTSKSFESIHIDLFKDPMISNTICEVEISSASITNFTILQKNMKFLRKCPLQNSDFIDSDLFIIWNFL